MKKKFTLSRTLITACIATAIVVIGSSSVKTNQSLNHAAGSSVSGSSGGCGCHSKGVAPGGVTIVGLPPKLQVGSVDTFKLHIDNNSLTAMKWGFAMKATGGTLSSVNSNVGKASTGALYHKAAFSSTSTTYDIVNLIVTAPATPGTVTFAFAAMAGTNASGSTGHGYKGTLSIPVIDSTLPVSLTSFSANVSANKVNLAWASATEQDVSYFGIQRSNDGVNFVTVGKVTASGTSTTTHSYSFVDDASKLSGAVYYRLNTVDKNGKGNFSAVKQVSTATTKNQITNMYPNPMHVGQDLKLNYTSLKSGTANIQLTNVLGAKVINTNLSVTSGNNTLTVAAGHLAPGVYYVTLTTDNVPVQRLSLLVK